MKAILRCVPAVHAVYLALAKVFRLLREERHRALNGLQVHFDALLESKWWMEASQESRLFSGDSDPEKPWEKHRVTIIPHPVDEELLIALATEAELLDCPAVAVEASQLPAEILDQPELDQTVRKMPWPEKEFEHQPRIVRLLLNFMRDRERADLNDVCRAVWDEVSDHVTRDAIKSALAKANGFLERNNVPWRLSKDAVELVRV